jgi:hypothetical protein
MSQNTYQTPAEFTQIAYLDKVLSDKVLSDKVLSDKVLSDKALSDKSRGAVFLLCFAVLFRMVGCSLIYCYPRPCVCRDDYRNGDYGNGCTKPNL